MSIEDDYQKRYTALVDMSRALGELLGEHCKGLPRIDRISARAKSVNRFVAKAFKTMEDGTRKYVDPLNEIQDQIGARIITFYPSDVVGVADEVSKYFKAVEVKSLIPESESKFGYVGRHFIFFLPSDVTAGVNSDLVPQFFELQVKTLFQHAWAEANHDLAYKPPVPMSTQQKRLIAFTAAQAWGADQVFDQLFDELVNLPRITIENIEQYRAALAIGSSDLKCGMWDIFDRSKFDGVVGAAIKPLRQIVSTKDQRLDQKFLAGKKADPRQNAFDHMQLAAAGREKRREPLTVVEHSDGLFYILNGNATVQVLMLAGWEDVPVVVQHPKTSDAE